MQIFLKRCLICQNCLFSKTFFSNLPIFFYTDIAVISVTFCNSAQRPPVQCQMVQGDFYRTQVYLGSDLWVRVSVTEGRFASYTSCTSYTSYTSYRLHIEKVTVSTLEDSSWCKWCHLVAKFATNASGAI